MIDWPAYDIGLIQGVDDNRPALEAAVGEISHTPSTAAPSHCAGAGSAGRCFEAEVACDEHALDF
jgi:hypothetical protein